MKRLPSLCIAIALAATLALASDETTHWDYDGQEGPEHWGEIHPEYDICDRGQNQSPINLVADVHADLPKLEFEYDNRGILKEVNTGHAIQESVPPGNYVFIEEDRFELKQFHFHSPSEHLVEDESFPMEVHLVHQNEQGQYVVIGLLFVEGERNEVMDRLPSFRRERGENPYGDTVSVDELVTDRGDYFLYNGSLTTPPCTEGVKWIVIKQPIIASPEQIEHYHDLLGFDNNRPIQPHNSRIIVD